MVFSNSDFFHPDACFFFSIMMLDFFLFILMDFFLHCNASLFFFPFWWLIFFSILMFDFFPFIFMFISLLHPNVWFIFPILMLDFFSQFACLLFELKLLSWLHTLPCFHMIGWLTNCVKWISANSFQDFFFSFYRSFHHVLFILHLLTSDQQISRRSSLFLIQKIQLHPFATRSPVCIDAMNKNKQVFWVNFLDLSPLSFPTFRFPFGLL